MSGANPIDLSTVPLFADLSDAERAAAAAMLRPVAVPAGEVIYHAGEPGGMLYVIASGEVAISLKCGTGQAEDALLRTARAGDAFGEWPGAHGASHSATAEAVRDSELLALDRAGIERWIQGQVEIALRLIDHLSANVPADSPQAPPTVAPDSVQRLANVLLFLAERDGRIDAGLVTSALRIKDVAVAIGASEEWVSGMLHEWSCNGLIGMTGTRRLLLHDVAALKALAKRDD